MGARSVDGCSGRTRADGSVGGKCERVDKWREDAQPGRPRSADGSRRFAEADEDARETRVLPLAERPAEPGVRDGAETFRAACR